MLRCNFGWLDGWWSECENSSLLDCAVPACVRMLYWQVMLHMLTTWPWDFTSSFLHSKLTLTSAVLWEIVTQTVVAHSETQKYLTPRKFWMASQETDFFCVGVGGGGGKTFVREVARWLTIVLKTVPLEPRYLLSPVPQEFLISGEYPVTQEKSVSDTVVGKVNFRVVFRETKRRGSWGGGGG